MRISLFMIMMLISIFIMGKASPKIISSVQLYQKNAERAINELDTDVAKTNILKAISMIESYKLTEPEFANIYILAAVLNLMVEDGVEAPEYIKKALKLNKDVQIPENFSTDEINEIFNKAKEDLESETQNTFVLDSVKYEITFTPIEKHVIGNSYKINLKVNPLPPAGYEVNVFYVSQSDEYESLKLTKLNDEYVGEIPASTIKEPELKLYVMLIDAELNPVTNSGSPLEPHIIKVVSQNDIVVKKDTSNEKKEKKQKEKEKKSPSIISLQIEAGTGLGIPSGKTEILKQEVSSGFAWSPLWFGGDLSFFIKEKLSIGAFTRIQTIEKDFLAGARVKLYLAKENAYSLSTFLGVAYGNLRYQVSTTTTSTIQDKDVVKAGFLALNVGGSAHFMLSNNFGFIVSANSFILAPDFAIHFDFSSGIYLEF
ncbi:hypothetical protein JXR93_10125 [bacterium]|nr:hypothetical protein [bacterium]